MYKFFVGLLFVALVAVMLALCGTSVFANCGVFDLPKADMSTDYFTAQIVIAPEVFPRGDTTVSVRSGSPIVCQTDFKNGNLDGTGHIIPDKAQAVYPGQNPAPFFASQMEKGLGCDPMFSGMSSHVVVCTGADQPTQDAPTQTSGATFQ